MEQLKYVYKWKHDQSPDTWSSLYKDPTPKEGLSSVVPHYDWDR